MVRWVVGCAQLLLLVGIARAEPKASEVEFFERRIRPVLVEHCYECHSQDAKKNKKLRGGLYLDSRAGLLEGGDNGPAIKEGRPNESLLLKSIRHEGNSKMPPQNKLPATVVADFTRWIEMGAPDPRDGQTQPKKGIDLVEGRKFWSLQPVKKPPVPSVADDDWPRSDLDRFVFATLKEKNLKPVGDADRRTLLRRAYFDLIGLPPTPEQLRAFLDDDSPRAFAKVVDGLLASPHFGERWGRHWLDLARYSESNGKDRNVIWHHAWRYRDWVIDAFNRDLPFDRFVREQIAGDLMDANSDAERDRQVTATGFLALGPKAFEERKRELFRMDMIDEQIDVVSRSILGLSVACARCHDHKFDPIPTKDYYSLAGIFRSTHTLYGPGPKGINGLNDAELQPIGPNAAELGAGAAKHLKAVQDQTQKRNTARADRYRVVRDVADLQQKMQRGGDAASIAKQIETKNSLIQEWDAKIKSLDADLKSLIDNPPPQPGYALAARDASKPDDGRIYIRGDIATPGEPVRRGLLRAIEIPGLAPIEGHQSGRKQLAEWLSHPSNPLTPRVAVNRVWLHLFGRGIVATPDDFGINGSRPSHPELLDHLAANFMADGWSVKKLVRSIVLSRTYQLESRIVAANQEADPDNVFLWRWKPRRLEAEPFRDAVLAVSGQLLPQPMERSLIAKLDPFKDEEYFPHAVPLKPENMEHRHRSVYLPIVRGYLPETLKTFDFADPNAPIGMRDETTVPIQASFLMNSPWMLAQARHWAERMTADGSLDEDGRIERMYEMALGRAPTDAERRRVREYLAQPEERLPTKGPAPTPAQQQLERWISVGQTLLASAEFRYVF
jgi:hypothetical protein